MIIKDIRCEQFAGLQETKLNREFSDRLNILLGANETGKSTMIDLMYHLLFQDVKVRKNGDFQDIYFPKKAEGIAGDYVKGEIIFGTERGEYKLSKSWEGTSGRCKLTPPDGNSIINIDKINEILLQELVYGKGVYDEVIFASQKRTMTLLQSLFVSTLQKLSKEEQEKVKVKNELSSIVTKAVMETGGIAIDELEKKLKDILFQYGERWDFEADAPEDGVQKRGIHHKWSCATSEKSIKENLAIILRAYYAMEEIADMQKKAKNAEDAVDDVNVRLEKAKNKRNEIRAKREEFQKYRSRLERRKDIKGLKSDVETSVDEMKKDAVKWPQVEEKRNKAKELQKKQKDAKCRELYNSVNGIKNSLQEKKKELAKLSEVDPADVTEAFRLEKKAMELSSQLKGLNLIAKMKQLGDVVPEICSVESGEILSSEDGTYSIREAITIMVPGILELQLMPSGVDVDAVKNELEITHKSYHLILQKYCAINAENLREIQGEYTNTKGEVRQLEREISFQLGEFDWDSVVFENSLLPERVVSVSEISNQISELCKDDSLDAFWGKQNGIISQYEEKYKTKSNLTKEIDKKVNDIEEFQAELDSLDNIPEEYDGISDPNQYDEELKKDEDTWDKKLDKLRNELSDKVGELGEQTAEEYSELLIEKQEEFAAQKEVYKKWKKIDGVVKQVKEALAGNPMQDIEEKFRDYLGLLSNGSITLRDFNDHMDSAIASGKNQLSYEILSEGTKDTIALAFRLAILEYLYPEGGGLAVFDDPFTDMDPERTEQACKLIQKFAEKNQVIFVTCDSKYTNILTGRVIELIGNS